MGLEIVVTIHGGFDWATSMAIRRARDAVVLLSTQYMLEASIDEVILPVAEDEAPRLGLPEVSVSINGKSRVVARGRAPGLDEIVDAVFKLLEEEYGFGLLAPIALGDNEAEEGLLSM